MDEIFKDLRRHIDLSIKAVLDERECVMTRFQRAIIALNEIVLILNYDCELDDEERKQYYYIQNDLLTVKHYLLVCIERGVN